MARDLKAKVIIEAEDRASRDVQQAEGAFRRFGNFLRQRFVITLGDVAAASRAAFAQIQEAANLESTTNALRIQLQQQGQDFDEYLAKLDEVAQGTISRADLIQRSSEALLLGIPAEEVAQLLDIARASAIASGRDIGLAFEEIVNGVARGSSEILNNLGIIVRAQDAYENYAAQLGKSVEQLTAQERQQSLLNEVLRVGTERVEAYGDAQSTTAQTIQQGQAALENFTNRGVNAFLGALQVAIGISLDWLRVLSLIPEGIAKIVSAISNLLVDLPFVGRFFAEARDNANDFDNSIDGLQERIATLAKQLREGGSTLVAVNLGLTEATDSTKVNTAALDANTAAQDENNKAKQDGAEVEDDYASAIERANDAVEDQIRGQERLQRALVATQQQLAITGAEFDRLRRNQGEQAAVDAALAAGGELILGGTRINLAGGGSRLTSQPGLGVFSRV